MLAVVDDARARLASLGYPTGETRQDRKDRFGFRVRPAARVGCSGCVGRFWVALFLLEMYGVVAWVACQVLCFFARVFTMLCQSGCAERAAGELRATVALSNSNEEHYSCNKYSIDTVTRATYEA